ncbi:uncharacterized protein LOC143686104 [Tamandua tetradactyla]|uniref:uncharacterized protein LOC143686104 n=1 Tax=Tamandua tetradactyla TaxID=48850 RepID=UPI004053BD34
MFGDAERNRPRSRRHCQFHTAWIKLIPWNQVPHFQGDLLREPVQSGAPAWGLSLSEWGDSGSRDLLLVPGARRCGGRATLKEESRERVEIHPEEAERNGHPWIKGILPCLIST